jgi:hypothetical protein
MKHEIWCYFVTKKLTGKTLDDWGEDGGQALLYIPMKFFLNLLLLKEIIREFKPNLIA